MLYGASMGKYRVQISDLKVSQMKALNLQPKKTGVYKLFQSGPFLYLGLFACLGGSPVRTLIKKFGYFGYALSFLAIMTVFCATVLSCILFYYGSQKDICSLGVASNATSHANSSSVMSPSSTSPYSKGYENVGLVMTPTYFFNCLYALTSFAAW